MIKEDLLEKIDEFCELNDISDRILFINKLTETGLNIEKYGVQPFNKEKEVEVIKEVIKEVPVEVIKEVIKEIPVEVTKEVEKIVEIEKKVFVTDDEANIALKEELTKTKLILKDTITEFDEERKANSVINNQHESEIIELESDIKKLNQDISDLNNKIKQLEDELQIEKSKPKKQDDDDIYGEGKVGSNLY